MVKLIENFPNYTISSEGEIINNVLGTKKSFWLGSNGYFNVSLCFKNNQKNLLVHRLLAIHFLPLQEERPHVNHKDGNKLNNSIENLEWCTVSENVKHAYDFGLRKSQRKFDRSFMDEILDNRFLLGENITNISKDIGLSLSSTSKHLREAAVSQDRLEEFEVELKRQKSLRAAKAGEDKTKVLRLAMIDKLSYEIVAEFSSYKQATTALGKSSCGPISNVLAGRTKTGYGYIWVLLPLID